MLHVISPKVKSGRDKAADNIDAIPSVFCWTKMGAEAGQPLTAILSRKELERSAGGGTFAWGIGSSLGDSAELAKRVSPSGEVEVLFTPMKSPPKAGDVSPAQLLLWMFYQSPTGGLATLPEHMLVTSRGGGDKRSHYALLCQSESKIEDGVENGVFDSSWVRNLATRNPVGASQVTSIVRYEKGWVASERPYRIAFKAKLYAEGFVRLAEPVVMDCELTALYEAICQVRTVEDWCVGVRRLRKAALAAKRNQVRQKQIMFS